MVDYYKVFLDIMDNFQKYYSYLSFKRYSIEQLIRRYGPAIKRIKDEKIFVRTLVKILALFEDGHIGVTDSKGGYHVTYSKKAVPNYDLKLTRSKYFPEGLKLLNRAGEIGLYSDILYVHIHTWSPNFHKHIQEIFRFFKFVITNYKYVLKMILDVRSNRGGSDLYAEKFLSYLIPKGHRILVARYLYRLSPKDPSKLGKETIRTVASDSSIHFNGQIAVLIGNESMSSNELFVMGLESLKHLTGKVTLIGDTTFGSSGNAKEFTHPSGIRYMIPSWVCYTSRGKLLEGNGVKPDIHINSKSTISWGKDKAFEAALKVLKPLKL